MKTNQVMIRQMGVFQVEQRTKDAMFNATALLKQWNNTSKSDRKMELYFNSPKTQEFVSTIMARENLHTPKSVYVKSKASRGANAGTWMSPVLFIDFAMWINPSFKYDVIKFVFDRMIEFRNEAGDAYKELASAVQKIVQPNFMKVAMKKVGEALNWIIFNRHEKALRNKHGDEKQMQSLFDLERETAMLINKGFIKDFKSLVTYLRDEYKRRNTPSVFLSENIKEAIA